MLSLNNRLLLTASIVLAAFFGLTGFVLDEAYRNSAENALKDRLQGHTYALIAAAEVDNDGIVHLTHALPEPRFFTVGSGLFGEIRGNSNQHTWRSPSMESIEINFIYGLTRGARQFDYLFTSDGMSLYAFSIGVTWDEKQNTNEGYTFSVAENLVGYYADINAFRNTLWGWLGSVAIVFLIVQGLILRWSLRPLRDVADDLTAIEAGKQTQLEAKYPKELQGLTGNLNALINSEREHQARYRNTLGNLAHSLKTPLALLRGAIEAQDRGENINSLVQEQVDRMSQIIEYQLQRAATSGRTVLTTPIPVESVIRQIVSALDKVYADKGIQCNIIVTKDTSFYGDQSDLMECLGNLIDNAYKWCNGKVIIKAQQQLDDNRRRGLEISVEDNGPGISPQIRNDILQRGVRGDQTIEGHGIGLAMVRDIVGVYNGLLNIEKSSLGGARVTIIFPGNE